MLISQNSFLLGRRFLRSHLSSADESVWPAMKLVPVSVMLSLADWSVHNFAPGVPGCRAPARHLLDDVVAVLQGQRILFAEGQRLLREVPSLLCSCEGSTRASTARLVPN